MSDRTFLIGYNTSGFSRCGDLDRVLEEIRGAGFEAVELAFDPKHLHPLVHDGKRMGQVRRRLQSLGLALVCGAGGRFAMGPEPHRPSLLEADPQARGERLRYLTRAIRAASDLGASVLTFHSGPLVGGEEAWGWGILTDALERLLAEAGRTGVTLALEFHPAMFVSNLSRCREVSRLLAEAGNIRMTLDIGHVQCTEGRSIPEVIAEVAGEVCAVHLEDIRGREHRHLPIGEGEISFGPVFEAFRRTSYAGVVAAEFHSGEISLDEIELCRRTHRVLCPYLS
jgi:sugar phosphate isomerase/epimerase